MRLVFMKYRICLLAAALATAFTLSGRAQTDTQSTNYVTVTNFVTLTTVVTNYITVTNLPAVAPAPAPEVAKASKVETNAATGEKVAVPPVYHWDNSITAGLTLTRGNSESTLATVKYAGDKKTPVNEYSLEGDATYGSANGQTAAQFFHGFGQWNHLFSDRWYDYLRAEGLHDQVAEIKYRLTLTAGMGYYFIKETNTTLSGEVGPGVVFERDGTVDNTFATLRFAEKGEHKFFGGNARVWESIEVLPQVDKWSDYLVNSEVGIESALRKNLSLSVFLDDYYDSEPATNRKRNDEKLVSAVTYKF
jgi:putative salt-induced outer membrane protein YdiY